MWAATNLSVRERSEAVNRYFTNGTPVPRIVEVLGTNFTRLTPYSAVSVDGSRITCSLLYKFGEEDVVIGTTAGLDQEPATAYFTGAGYSVHSK